MVDSKSVDNALAWFPEWGWWCLNTSLSVWACLCDVGFYFSVLSTVRWNHNDVQKRRKLNFTEKNLTTGLIFMIVVVNIFITAIRVHRPNHSDWPNTRRCLVFFPLCSHSFNAPLFLNRQVFFLILCEHLAPMDIHVVSMFWAPPLLTSTTSYLTYKHTDPSRLSEKFPPENNQKAENPFWACKKETSAVTKGVWYVNGTTFVSVGGQTGK